jgi:hypothetical protein
LKSTLKKLDSFYNEFFFVTREKKHKTKAKEKLLSSKSYPPCISMEVERQLRRRHIKIDKGGDRFGSYLG